MYGSWFSVFFYGLRQIRLLFPQLGLAKENYEEDVLADHYPGGLSLYDFVLKSAHTLDSMILL